MSGQSLFLLDTNMVTYLAANRSDAARQAYLKHEKQRQIAISTITQAEMIFGLRQKPEATRLRFVFEKFFAEVDILPFDSAAAYTYGTLRAQLTRAGKTLSQMDLLIASHAIATGATLVTHDQAFRHASPSLSIVDWATDLYPR